MLGPTKQPRQFGGCLLLSLDIIRVSCISYSFDISFGNLHKAVYIHEKAATKFQDLFCNNLSQKLP